MGSMSFGEMLSISIAMPILLVLSFVVLGQALERLFAFWVRLRLPTAMWERVRDRLESAQAAIAARSGCRFAINGGFSRPPMEENPATDRLFSAWRHAALDLGLTPPAKVHSGGGSDANLIAATGVPCLDGLGVVGGRLHSADEFVHLPSLVERAQLTALGLHRLAAGEIVLD